MVTPDFEKMNGLLPVIVQDYESGEVLMLAYMNEDAWKNTLATKKATYYSRSRKKLWIKGETSGNTQMVKEIYIDCDNDTILIKVEQIGGAACHTGYKSCFYRQIRDNEMVVIGKPLFDPKRYTIKTQNKIYWNLRITDKMKNSIRQEA